MLEKLFGNAVIEKILFFLLRNEKAYGSEVAQHMNIALYSVQQALKRLEDGGIIVAQSVGKTRVYQFNPRYPFQDELKLFLEKAYTFLPEGDGIKYERAVRKRPRKTGKPLVQLSDD
jgi:hypothetical protein